MMLDTHIASDEDATHTYSVGGEVYGYRRYKEKGGYAGVFSGMYDLAKWLHLDDLKKASQLAGYTEIEVAEVRAERKVRTVLLFARPMSHLPMGRGR